MKRSVCVILLSLFTLTATAGKRAQNLHESLVKLDSVLTEHCGTKSYISSGTLKTVGKRIDVYLPASAENLPWRPSDEAFIKSELKKLLPAGYSSYRIGNIYYGKKNISELVVSYPGNSGSPAASSLRISDRAGAMLTDRGINASRGLRGRHIALWQSHGYYFNTKDGQWHWQRPNTFQTIEDIYTQSYVVPFLVPMLENAGANVLLPRERDYHDVEIIIDNDRCETTSGRIHGKMSYTGSWTKDEKGFADNKAEYSWNDNPFERGTSINCKATTSIAKEQTVTWRAEIPSRGEWAVYVSYQSYPKSSKSAHYTVHAYGHDENVTVNQNMGGGTWVYLGTFDFDKGEQDLVSLSNYSSDGGMISADAVKIGGGMGNIARSVPGSTDMQTSGMPRFAEAARYFLQWSGYQSKIWGIKRPNDDYADDLVSRGAWVRELCGGSWANPDSTGRKIPIDMSLGFHTDAGVRPDSEIVGTLAIYTLNANGTTKLLNKSSRKACREVTDVIQTQLVDDIRSTWDSEWTRRMLWNRSYSECRTTGVPAILLELLSHHNFEDMKYGLDPKFRFDVSRSIYKGILKYMSMRYNCPYVVQPLPVHAFSAVSSEDGIHLSWKESIDELEPTAKAQSFIVYTRVDNGGWDNGVKVVAGNSSESASATIEYEKGHIYSFKIVAANEGGISFPSEILSVGIPSEGVGKKVLIVNNFNRISGPAWFDSPSFAGFDNKSDSGVPYMRDWCFSGEQTDFDRSHKNTSVKTFFGTSDSTFVKTVIAGNTFDYPMIHGASLLKAGYAFDSSSLEAFTDNVGMADGHFALDIICGKECTVRTSTRSALRGGIFTPEMIKALEHCCNNGTNIIISGAYIATDIYSSVYPIEYDFIERAKAQEFVKKYLGYALLKNGASTSGAVSIRQDNSSVTFPVAPCGESYCVESPDALYSFQSASDTYMSYTDSHLPAAIWNTFSGYKVAAFGFPLEIIREDKARDKVINDVLDYFSK